MSESFEPKRSTRRKIVYWLMGLLTSLFAWMFLPGDIGEREMSLAIVMAPTLIGGIIAWITGETYSDHSRRKHGADE